LLTFSDVLIFIDQQNSVNVARIKNGELQYVEKLPVDNPIICAAVSPCNSIILMASSELTFHVWKEDQTSQPLHWVASNTGKLLDFSRLKTSEVNVYCECCITSDSTKGVLALCLRGEDINFGLCPRSYLILVDLNSKITTTNITFSKLGNLYAGNSYCIGGIGDGRTAGLVAVNLATGEYLTKWWISDVFRRSPLIVGHSKNDLVATITECPASIRFLKIVVPE
jgi:WD40 repeat protein